MTQRVLALTEDGRLTYCTCSPEKRGTGRCNHKFHQKDGESAQDFAKRAGSHEFDKDTNVPNPSIDNEAIIKAWNQNALDETKKFLETDGCCIINQATGTGKSSIMSAIIDEHYQEQSVFFSPAMEINSKFAEHNQISRSMTLGNLSILTYQKILNATSSQESFEKFCKQNIISLPIKVLCLDEIHHLGDNDLDGKDDKKWKEAISKVIAWGTDENTLIVGASATIDDDKSVLDGRFENKLSSRLSFEDAVERGIIQMPNIITRPNYDILRKLYADTTKVVSSKGKYTGDYRVKVNAEAIISQSEKEFQEKSRAAIIDKIAENDKSGIPNKIVVFSSSTYKTKLDAEEYQQKIQELFPGRKVISKHYHTGSDGKYNEKYFHEFCSGEFEEDKDAIRIISVYGCLNEGVHADASIMIQNRNTESMSLHDQQKGRILDIKHNTRGLVIDNSSTYYGNSFHNYQNLSEKTGSEYVSHGIEDIVRLDYQRTRVHKDGTASKAAQKSFISKNDFAKSDLTVSHEIETSKGTISKDIHIGNVTRDMFFSKKCKKEIMTFMSKNADMDKNSPEIKIGLFNIIKKYPEYDQYLEIIGINKYGQIY